EAAAQEPELRTELPRLRRLGLEVRVRELVRLRERREAVEDVAGDERTTQLVRIRVVTDAGPACTQLAVVQPVVLDVERVREDEAARDRRVEVRPAVLRQRRRPVVTTGERQERVVVVADFGLPE